MRKIAKSEWERQWMEGIEVEWGAGDRGGSGPIRGFEEAHQWMRYAQIVRKKGWGGEWGPHRDAARRSEGVTRARGRAWRAVAEGRAWAAMGAWATKAVEKAMANLQRENQDSFEGDARRAHIDRSGWTRLDSRDVREKGII